ncbi:hypothetical protein [Vibrio sp.]|uniref:hypothetical protein n=1 Tax=Vibrio sp. TaxID=678 RepID=UPI003D146CE9
MNLHRCTIVLNDDRILQCKTVEQSLNVIEKMDRQSVTNVIIDASDGINIHTYPGLTLEESIESLMNL